MPCGLQRYLLEETLILNGLQKDPRKEATLTSQCEHRPVRLCLKVGNLGWVMCSGNNGLNWTEE